MRDTKLDKSLMLATQAKQLFHSAHLGGPSMKNRIMWLCQNLGLVNKLCFPVQEWDMSHSI